MKNKKQIHKGYAAIDLISLIFVILVLVDMPANALVTTYPAPSEELLSTDYAVTADGQSVSVYKALGQTQYGGDYSFCNFDFSGSVTIVITTSKSLLNCIVLPKSFGIVPTISGNTATITLSQARNISIEPDGRNAPLLLFANPREINPPQKYGPGVIYYDPGIYSPTNNTINLYSNQTLYLAGGSIIKGSITCNGNNIKICGRGLIDGNQWGHFGKPGFVINLDNRKNITIEGITVRGSWVGTLWPQGNDSTVVRNVKICNGRFMNEDAISSYNSTNIIIEKCFLRSDDDCLPIKSTSKNIRIDSCVVWCDRARAFCIGEESDPGYCENILISNIDVIHYGMPVFWFRPGNSLVQRNIRFENINVDEVGASELFHFTPTDQIWNGGIYQNGAGSISGVYFSNISISHPNAEITITGFDNSHLVDNVTFNHVTRNGVVWARNSSGLSINQFTNNIRFIDSSGTISTTRAQKENFQNTIAINYKMGKVFLNDIHTKTPLLLLMVKPDGKRMLLEELSGQTAYSIPFVPSSKGIYILRVQNAIVNISKKIVIQ